MKTLIRALILIFLFIPQIYAQNKFEINFGNTNLDIGYSIKQTFDGKYIVTGATDSSSHSNVLLTSIDTNGTILWSKSLGGAMEEAGNSIIQTGDSGFVIIGYTNSYGYGFTDMYLIKTNVSGDTLWTNTYGGLDYDYGNVVKNTFDGGLILGGQESSTASGPAHIYLVKTDASGDIMWTKSYPMGSWASASDIVQTPDSGYLVYGDFANNVTGTGDYDLVWIKTDQQGNIQWTKTYEDSSSHDYAQSIRETFDGGFIVAGEKEGILAYNNGTIILRVDVNGDTLWTKQFGLNSFFTVTDILQTSDSGFVTTGYTYDTLLLANYLFILKMNSSGDSLWTKYYDGLFNAVGFSIENTFDNGFILSGLTSDSGSNHSDVYIIKTDDNGDVFLCQSLIISQLHDTVAVEGNAAGFVIETSPAVLHHQWQVDSTGVFINIQEGGYYSGTTTDSLHISSVQLLMDGNSYRCIVQSSLNCNDTSAIGTLNTLSIGISETYVIKSILYPNPASKILGINGEIPELLIIYNIFGESISEYRNVQDIDISFLANGLYYVKLYYKKENETSVLNFFKN